MQNKSIVIDVNKWRQFETIFKKELKFLKMVIDKPNLFVSNEEVELIQRMDSKIDECLLEHSMLSGRITP